MNRLELLRLAASMAGLAVASTGCGLQAPSAAKRIPRIGYGSYGPRETYARDWIDPFLQGLSDLGYVDGKNIAIEWRFTRDQSDAEFRRVAAELVGLSPDVIVSGNAQGIAGELRRATSTTPIVAYMLRAVETGLVASLAHPRANLTGPSGDVPGGFAKHVDLLRDVVPGLTRVVYLFDARPAVRAIAGEAGWNLFGTAAEAAGLQADRLGVLSADDVDALFEMPAMQWGQAFLSAANGPLQPAARHLAELAIQRRLASITNTNRDLINAGLLMTYGPDLPSIARRVAVYVGKILNGATPSNLPVEQPTVFDLAVNVKTVRALGLTIPPSVQPLVTEWVQ